MKRNLIAHSTVGGSDKIYMVCIRKLEDGIYMVFGKNCRRGNKMIDRPKLTTPDITEAEKCQLDIFRKELKKGYIDIDDSSYNGPVSRLCSEVKEALEVEVDSWGNEVDPTTIDPKTGITPPKKAPAAPAPKKAVVKEEDVGVVVCVNNLGMEDRFDVGIEYVSEEAPTANAFQKPTKEMILVYDKNGNAFQKPTKEMILVDKNGEYVSEEAPTANAFQKPTQEMIVVYDKNGDKGEFFRDRFVKPSEYKKGVRK